MTSKPSQPITTTRAAEILDCTRQYVLLLINQNEFPGATKISEMPNAPYLIPEAEVLAYKQKRGQSRKRKKAHAS